MEDEDEEFITGEIGFELVVPLNEISLEALLRKLELNIQVQFRDSDGLTAKQKNVALVPEWGKIKYNGRGKITLWCTALDELSGAWNAEDLLEVILTDATKDVVVRSRKDSSGVQKRVEIENIDLQTLEWEDDYIDWRDW